MSLTSRRSIQHAGPDTHEETIVSFRREKNNTYTKVTNKVERDHKTGGVKEQKRLTPTEEGPYSLVKNIEEGFDERVAYEDIDGSLAYMYFKKIV